MNVRDITVPPDVLEQKRRVARSALGESPALQDYLVARFAALATDAGASADMKLLVRAHEVRSILDDLFLLPNVNTERAPKL